MEGDRRRCRGAWPICVCPVLCPLDRNAIGSIEVYSMRNNPGEKQPEPELPQPSRASLLIRIAIGAVFALMVGALVVEIVFFPGKPFDASEWQDKESVWNGARIEMADRLLAWGVLEGKSRAELKSMLGEPFQSGDTKWLYFLGQQPSFNPFAPPVLCDWLAVDFGEDNRVCRCSVHSSTHCGGR